MYSANGFDGIVNKDSLKRVKHSEEAVLKIENEWVRDSVKNYEKALAKRIDKYLTVASKYDYIPALRWLYKYYLQNNADDPSLWMGYLNILSDAKHNHPQSQYDLAQCWRTGLGGLQTDYVRYSEWLQKAASSGHVESEFELAKCYYLGLGVTQDLEQASQWFRLASDSGHCNAQYYYGTMLLHGNGVSKDEVSAIAVLKKSASSGNVSAQMALGNYYSSENVLGQDFSQAIHYFQLAANQDNSIAQYKLAMMFYEGKGVEKGVTSEKKAFELMSKSARKNNIDAQYMLAQFYQKSIGTEIDEKHMLYWFEQAAVNDHLESQYKLGEL